MENQTDFLVIGSGVAGLTFALKAAESGSVALVTKKQMADCNTSKAQGGVASVFSRLDSFDLHIKDTLDSGDGLCDEEVVTFVVKNGPDRIRELIRLGVQFNREKNAGENGPSPDSASDLSLGREGGHSRNRIVHAQDMTGREIERVLIDHIRAHDRITVYEDHIAIDLITFSTRIHRGVVTTSHKELCCGAYVLDRKQNRVKTFQAKMTLLATGGAGKAYLYTSNPDVATGDGIAMGYRAGATVANMEFVQFHPTCLYHPEAKNFLISEAVRGEGGILVDKNDRAFMEAYDPLKDLACRDVVARAIDTELKKSGDDAVYIDITHKPADFVRDRFPNIYEQCLSFGYDMTKDPVPVVPAAHYLCGGVATDLSGKTDIERLYCVGETSCTGLHGANRLASNSLAEALVYAHAAAGDAVKMLENALPNDMPEVPDWDDSGTVDPDELIMVAHNWDEIRRLMWNYVGIVRSDKRLSRARHRIDIIQKEIHEYYWDFKVTADLIELRNIATVAELIIRSAQRRKESRGLHFNIGYPERDDKQWQKNTIFRGEFVE